MPGAVPVFSAVDISIRFSGMRSPGQISEMVSNIVTSIARECHENGSSLIGHVKCLAESTDGRRMVCSVVSHEEEAECRGEVGQTLLVELSLVSTVYDLDQAIFDRIVDKAVRTASRAVDPKAEMIERGHGDLCAHIDDHGHSH